MKVRVLSDVHLEHEDFVPPKADADVVVLAGDIHVKTRALAWIREHFGSVPVVYVPGNHEYYGAAIPRITDKLRDATSGTDVHVLDNAAVVIDGTTFLGATLWTDFELFGDPNLAMIHASEQLTDYRRVRVSPKFGKMRPRYTRSANAHAVAWLRGALSTLDGSAIVVSHHAPSVRSLPSEFAHDSLSPAYASRLDELVAHSNVALWIHGHVHHPSDYSIGGTRVICNPRGYGPNDLVRGFDPSMVVELRREPAT